MALFKKGTDTSLFLVPGDSGGHLDVKSDFDWTVSRRASRDDVVPCYLWEYQPNNAQLINALYYWGYQINALAKDISMSNIMSSIGSTIVGLYTNPAQSLGNGFSAVNGSPIGTANQDPLDVYKYRYVARPTGFDYILPYLGTQRFGVTNTFAADTLANTFEGLGKLFTGQWGAAAGLGNNKSSWIDEIGKGVLGSQAFKGAIQGFTDYHLNVMDTESWSSTDPDSISVEFDLLNTQSVQQANRNYEFCYLLNYQNHPAQRNAFLAQSPCIYTLFIPNTIYMPVCHMPSFTVTNLGQNKMIDGKAVPEAYRITMTFKGILNPPSRNMLSVLDSGYNKGKIELPQLFGTKETQAEQNKAFQDFLKSDKVGAGTVLRQ